MKNLRNWPSAILFSTLSIGVVHGQTAADGINSSGQPTSAGLDEIVVTAQRRSQSIQDIGIAVSAYSVAALKEKAHSSVFEASRKATSMTPSKHPSRYTPMKHTFRHSKDKR